MLLGVAGAAGIGGEARAQPGPSQESARSRYREAQSLMAAKRWDEALALLREVTKTTEAASVLYSIALCEENLGLWREALDHYRAALNRANDPVLDPGLKPATRKLLQRESRQNLEALSEKMPWVRVDHLPESDVGANYRIDGQPVAPDELLQGVRVNPGDHRLRAEAPGKRLIEATFRAEERGQIVVTLPSRFELLEAKPPAPVPAAPLPPEPQGGGWRVQGGWLGVGVGTMLAGAGVVASLGVDGIGRTHRNDPALRAYGAMSVLSGYEGRCEAAEEGLVFEGPGVASPARVRRLCSAQSTLRPLQYVFYGAGAILAGAGAYLLLTPERGGAKVRRGDGGSRVWVLPGFGPALLGGSVGGVF